MIETTQLRIRPFAPGDRGSFVRWHTHPPNRTFKWDGPLSLAAAERDFDQVLRNTAAGVTTYQAIDLRQSGATIGQIGLFPDQSGTTIALAYLIDEPHQGAGYATEASMAVIDDFRSQHPDRSIIAVIPDGHVASERVAGKLGMVPVRAERRDEMTVRVWELRFAGGAPPG